MVTPKTHTKINKLPKGMFPQPSMPASNSTTEKMDLYIWDLHDSKITSLTMLQTYATTLKTKPEP